MTNFPFGFGLPADDSGNDNNNREGQPDPAASGFDMTQLGAMLSQLGAMMSSATPSAGPVNYDLAKQMAMQALPNNHPVSSVDLAAVRDAVALAEVWLDGATSFPAGAHKVTAWTPKEWVEATMPVWQELCSPIADRMGGAMLEGLPEEAKAQAGPMMAMLGSVGGMAFGSHLGQALAQLASEVLTSTDIGLPMGPAGTAVLLPRALAEFGTSLGIDSDQARLFMAAREAAHQRLYASVPWLRKAVIATIAQYAATITVDFSAAEGLAANFNPADMAAIEQSLNQGMFSAVSTPEQEWVLGKLETMLALVEGWVDTVVSDAVGDRLPTASALSETLRRRRATGGPAEQTFASLIGMELRPRRLRAAAQLWRSLGESRGIDGRDTLWSDPDLLPTSADLDDPQAFVATDKQFNELLSSLEGLGTDLGDGATTTDPSPLTFEASSTAESTDRPVSDSPDSPGAMPDGAMPDGAMDEDGPQTPDQTSR
ncbi:zinc-dependent metalloprotease [Nakamurella antarctica]|uniref:Zinc-dependent metalloprotease n=1 Tax=Nakamurella antarctica TaxID=1902245 RepID=A0A3G8ZMM4_9ACTN|nr:zinc-dependent metalloprotease [Nakamurella antarctica]AZI58398.1 zinc-dependent metalloprotease [Nakamurella antarctica]